MKALSTLVVAITLLGCSATAPSVSASTPSTTAQSHATLTAGCHQLSARQTVNFRSPADGMLTLNARQGVSLLELDADGSDAVEIEQGHDGETGAVRYFAELDRNDTYRLTNNGANNLRYCYQPER